MASGTSAPCWPGPGESPREGPLTVLVLASGSYSGWRPRSLSWGLGYAGRCPRRLGRAASSLGSAHRVQPGGLRRGRQSPSAGIRRQEGSALQGPAPRLLLLRAVTVGTSALWESRAGLASPRGGSCWNWAAAQNPEHRGTLRALHGPSTSIPHPQAVVPRPAHPKGLLGWQGRIRPEGQAGLRPGPASAGSTSWNFSVGLGFPSRNRELLSWGGVRGPWPLTWGCLYPVASGVHFPSKCTQPTRN